MITEEQLDELKMSLIDMGTIHYNSNEKRLSSVYRLIVKRIEALEAENQLH